MAKFGSGKKWVIKGFSNLNRGLYRATGGKLGGKFPSGAPILLLTTIGRKSGKPRTQPLLFLADDDRLIIVASKGGHDHHPHWFLNLQANPEVDVQIRKDKRSMLATVASDEERERYWPDLCAMYDGYGKYETRTERTIPVIILTPR